MSSDTQDRVAGNRLLALLPAAEREHLRRHAEGSIRIIDRPGMEQRACECYGRVKGEYGRLFGGA